MIQANTVITGDSLTVLRDMEADSVDIDRKSTRLNSSHPK